jgi:hypothetical protein
MESPSDSPSRACANPPTGPVIETMGTESGAGVIVAVTDALMDRVCVGVIVIELVVEGE